MFSYKPNAICMAGMTMPVGAGHAASHCWNRVRKPRQLINYARFWPQWWTFAKNRTAHAQTHYRKSTQWQWASFVSVFFTENHRLWNRVKRVFDGSPNTELSHFRRGQIYCAHFTYKTVDAVISHEIFRNIRFGS